MNTKRNYFSLPLGDIDRETQSSYFINIVATDNATDLDEKNPLEEKRIGTTLVEITINDINDNDPMFSFENYTITVSEKVPVGRDIFTFKATDADIGVNGQVEYKAVSMNSTLFSLDSVTGIVKIKAALDYEEAITHAIIVYAEDKGKTLSFRFDSTTDFFFLVSVMYLLLYLNVTNREVT